jgi:predicted GNAT family acetyltransferase
MRLLKCRTLYIYDSQREKKMEYSVTFIPNHHHQEEIRKWLFEEDLRTKQGFYCNWPLIEKAFLQQQVAVITENDLTIGFLYFINGDRVVTIDIAEIKPEKRKKGIGRLLINSCLERFSQEGKMIVELFCEPKSSKKAWKKIGFLNCPPNYLKDNKIRMYFPLIEITSNVPSSEDEIIELWDFDPTYRTTENPKWVWKIERELNSNKLVRPIVHPSNINWQICWRKKDNIFELTQVKRFKSAKIEFDSFMIITELPII